jgi:hypothetical protein
VGGLDSNIDENYLKQVFTPYGEVNHVKIPVGKRCGFVQFTSRLRISSVFLLAIQGNIHDLIVDLLPLLYFQVMRRGSHQCAEWDSDWKFQRSSFMGP